MSLAPHAHPWGQLIYAASGVVSVWTEQGSWVAPPHWAVWAPAGVAHAHALHRRGVAAHALSAARPRAASAPRQRRRHSVAAAARADPSRGRRSACSMNASRRTSPSPISSCTNARRSSTPSLDLPLPHSARLRRSRRTSRTRTPPTVAATPRSRGASASARARSSAASWPRPGCRSGRWRRQARFLHALRRLGAGASVKRAATEAGYRSPSAFIAAFRVAFRHHARPLLQATLLPRGAKDLMAYGAGSVIAKSVTTRVSWPLGILCSSSAAARTRRITPKTATWYWKDNGD